jgi:hypothetical protein
MAKFNEDMKKVAEQQTGSEQEKLHHSLVFKANDDLLQTTYDKKMNEGKILSPTQIED